MKCVHLAGSLPLRSWLPRRLIGVALVLVLAGCRAGSPAPLPFATTTAPATLPNVLLAFGEQLVMLRGTDGQLLWQQMTPTAHLTVVDRTIVVADGLGTGVQAFSQTDGQLRWRWSQNTLLALGALPHAFAFSLSTHPPLSDPPSSEVVALNAQTGTLVWSHPHTLLVTTTPTVAILQDATGLLAVDGQTGQVRWHTSLTLTVSLSALTFALTPTSLIVVQTGQEFAAIALATGALLWQQRAALASFHPLIGATASQVYLQTPQGFAAYQTRTGQRNWDLALAHGSDPEMTVAPDGTLFVVSGQQQRLVAIDATSGHIRWTAPASLAPPDGQRYPGLIWPIGAVVYVVNGAFLAERRSSDGRLLWQVQTPGYMAVEGASPTMLIVNYLPVLVPPYYIVALDAGTGRLFWHLDWQDAAGSEVWWFTP